ncbi:sulfur carrier protein ThiS [Megasphaera paucivorans]|jgi:sulfur carrier protein|uniref:Sulfur carrier protein n=1 Tax=Megasphaera paucivorans TaxID=349095 RepID=A0A1H0B2D5_9FIRM|nr:sulfur carrier protein ThiS [Megasphaera paucivorans]SDN39755.1 sulfur carrier protein [Megasphaera paucivorans]
MTIRVNGKEITLEKSVNIDDLLVIAKAEAPLYVSVQLNENFVKRQNFAVTFVKENDVVEFLYFMGGGER